MPIIFATESLRQLAYGFTIPLLWAMMADVADYSEWKNRRRATAIVFSAIVFGLKAGLGFGGAIGGWLLSAYGYVPNVTQTERALQGIKLTASIFPAITFALAVVCLFFYRIDKRLEIQIGRLADDVCRTRGAEVPGSGTRAVSRYAVIGLTVVAACSRPRRRGAGASSCRAKTSRRSGRIRGLPVGAALNQAVHRAGPARGGDRERNSHDPRRTSQVAAGASRRPEARLRGARQVRGLRWAGRHVHVGFTLVWHQQTLRWVFGDTPVLREPRLAACGFTITSVRSWGGIVGV